MSERETRLKPLTLLQVGGVNQRVKSTELPSHEYVTLNGVWPEFAGLQSRVWGKRVLTKYPDAVYGIHQFWTPMGYGGGIYQFDGKVDFGHWLTPNSSFDLNIPPLQADGGGMTLDEFGNSYGDNFGYGTTNACLISFLNGSTDHSACLPPIAPAGTPDDTNGSPAGQGKKCQWESSWMDVQLDTYVIVKEVGIGNYSEVEQIDNVGRPELGCSLWPPQPPTFGPDANFQFYNAIATTGAIGSRQDLSSQNTYLPIWTIPGCDGLARITRRCENSYNHKVTFNFATLKSIGAYAVGMKLVGPGYTADQFVIIATGAIETGSDVHVDMEEYRNGGNVTHPTIDQSARNDIVTSDLLRIYVRQRVCRAP